MKKATWLVATIIAVWFGTSAAALGQTEPADEGVEAANATPDDESTVKVGEPQPNPVPTDEETRVTGDAAKGEAAATGEGQGQADASREAQVKKARPGKSVKRMPQGDSTVEKLYEHPLKGREAFVLGRGKKFTLGINLFGQVQGAFYVGDEARTENGDVASTEGFRLRRAKIGLHGTAFKHLGLNLVVRMVDLLLGESMIDAANIVFKPAAAFNLAVGTAPLPYSRGSMSSSSQLALIERPRPVTDMGPGSQLGLAVHGNVAKGIFGYSIGAYNGGEGLTKGDLGEGMLYAARLQLSPLGALDLDESDWERSPPRLAIGADYYYTNDSGVPTHAFSADIALKVKGFSFISEFLFDWRKPEDLQPLPASLPDATMRYAWYAQAAYFLLPKRIELAARFEWADDHMDIRDAGDVWLLTGGLNLYFFQGYLKLQFNYTHRDEREVPELNNDIFFAQLQVNL
jgi:hypothetical protein